MNLGLNLLNGRKAFPGRKYLISLILPRTTSTSGAAAAKEEDGTAWLTEGGGAFTQEGGESSSSGFVDIIGDSIRFDRKPGTGSHLATKPVSLSITTSCTITGFGSGVSLVSVEGTATVAMTDGTLSCSVDGVIYDLVDSEGRTWSLAEGTGDYVYNDTDTIVGTLVGFASDCWKESEVGIGHSWNNESHVVADGTGSAEAGARLPASYTSEGTLNSGKARQDPKPYGYTVDWDGVMYATLAETVTVTGDFIISIKGIQSSDTTGKNIISDGSSSNSNYIRFEGNGVVSVKIAGVYITGFGTVSLGTEYSLVISRIDDQVSVSIDGGDAVTKTVSSGNFLLTQISRDTTYPYIGNLCNLKITNSSDELIHHWVIEGSPDKTGNTIYDVVGGNHATIISGPTYPYSLASEYATYLAQYGGYVDTNAVIPYGGSSNPNSFGYALDAGYPGYFTLVQSKELWDVDSSLTTQFLFQSDGTQNQITADDLDGFTDSSYEDAYFHGTTLKKMTAFYNAIQVEPIVTRIKRYVA